MDADLSAFIKEHKARLANDRTHVKTQQHDGARRQWDRNNHNSQATVLSQDRAQTPADGGNLKLSGFAADDRKSKRRQVAQPQPVQQQQQPNPRRTNPGHKENIPPPTPEVGLISKLGQYEEKRKKLEKERQQEYKQLLHELAAGDYSRNQDISRLQEPAEVAATLLFDDRREQEQEKRRQRNQEYNDMLNQAQKPTFRPGKPKVAFEAPSSKHTDPEKYTKSSGMNDGLTSDRTLPVGNPGQQEAAEAFDDDRPNGFLEDEAEQRQRQARARPTADDTEFSASLPGVRNHPSAELQKLRERNREYNDFVQQKEMVKRQRNPYGGNNNVTTPRGGGLTPTYDEVLEKKRREEKQFRGYEDPLLYELPARTSRSDVQLQRYREELERLNQLDREYENKKVQFAESMQGGGRVQNNPAWTNVTPRDSLNAVPQLPFSPQKPPPGPGPARSRRNQPKDEEAYATLGVGRDPRASADARKKEAYRQDLLKQMQEQKGKKKRGNQEEADTFTFGGSQPPARQQQGFRGQASSVPQQQPTYLSGPLTTENNGSSVLGGGKGGNVGSILEAYNNPNDDAYFYYGKIDPLNANGAAAAAAGNGVPPAAPQQQQSFNPRNRQRFAENKSNAQLNSFPSDDDRRQEEVEKKKRYQQEILQQIEEDKRKKEQAKKEKERYDAKLEAEIRNYNPFGKGGGGAPLRDQQGNLISDLKQMHNENETTLLTPGRKPNLQDYPSPQQTYRPPAGFSDPQTTTLTPRQVTHRDANGDPSFARGGHGLFGDPKTEAQKTQEDRYKVQLKQQIEERKRQKDLEKQKEKEEEAKIARKIEEDLKQIQEEFEKEKRKEQEKKEAERLKMEEMARAQEEAKKRAEEEARAERERKAHEREEEARRLRTDSSTWGEEGFASGIDRAIKPARLYSSTEQTESSWVDEGFASGINRVIKPARLYSSKEQNESSPWLYDGSTSEIDRPIRPAKLYSSYGQDDRPLPSARSNGHQSGRSSPPVRKHSAARSRPPSGAVLQQLTNLRRQLQKEQETVDAEFKRERYEPDVYDPRLYQKPTDNHANNVDVFEVQPELNGHRDGSSRASNVNRQNVDEFRRLKKGGTQSRQQLHRMFPGTPSNNDALDTQQRVLLDAQEKQLRDLRKDNGNQSRGVGALDPRSLGLGREDTVASAQMLDADTAFIGVPDSGYPNDFENLPRYRNDSARSRRRQSQRENGYDTPVSRNPSSLHYDQNSNMGSTLSLNPDAISRRNDQRLQKLKALTGDEISTGDPEDVLANFMSKRQHQRPPSGRTLQDETWLRSDY